MDKRPTDGADRKAGETIPSPGKTKARVKAGGAASHPKDAAAEPRAGHGKASAGKGKPSGDGKEAAGRKARSPPRKAFLVAATLAGGDGAPNLRVYAAVMRSAEAALAAVRAEVGEGAVVELTGSLSTRMARTLGLAPDEIRPI